MNDYAVGISKVPPAAVNDLGEYIALFTNQGAWYGACSNENVVDIGSLPDIYATATSRINPT